MANILDEAIADIQRAESLSDYEAVDVLWVALVKVANSLPGNSEHQRMMSLAGNIPSASIRYLLRSQGVHDLLNLNPPLETILSGPYERLDSSATARCIQIIRSNSERDPQQALVNLGEILKRIRNKRAHGFKSSSKSRDREILHAARLVLLDLCRLVVK